MTRERKLEREKMVYNGEEIRKNEMKEKKQESRMRNWESLPKELWTDILLNFSIKHVVIFRSISKFFLSVIDHPNFGVLHFPRHVNDRLPDGGGYDINNDSMECQHCNNIDPNNCQFFRHVTRTNIVVIERPTNDGDVKGGLYVTKFGDILTPTHEFKFLANWGAFKCDVAGNVNGLLLLHKYKSRFKNWNSRIELILWNPLTSKTCLIPKSPLCKSGDYFVVNQPVKVGFGYDVVHDDYKIVAIVLYSVPQWPNKSKNPEFRAAVEVYSLRTESWRSFKVHLENGLYLGPKINYNGSIIWLAGAFNPNGIGNDNYNVDEAGECDGDISDNLDDHEEDVDFSHLVYFDLEYEELHQKNLPSSYNESPKPVKFPVVYNKSIAVFGIGSVLGALWKLEDDDSWDMPYDCPVDEKLLPSLLGSRVSNAILFVTTYCSDITVSLHGRGLLSYSVEDGTVLRHHLDADFMDAYVQSLLSPSNPFGSRKEQCTELAKHV